jgi:hypothetical protein
MFTQGFITRCLGVVRSSDATITYRPSEICTRYLKDAREHVPPMLDYDFSHLNQLVNQLGRRMHTVFMTDMCRHMLSRRTRAVQTAITAIFPKLHKSVCSFVTKHVLWTISGAPETSCRRPDASRYKHPQVQTTGSLLLSDPRTLDLIRLHRDHLVSHDEALTIDPDDGYFSDDNIRSEPHSA